MTEIPARRRVALRAGPGDLVTGVRRDLLAWVRQYGESGAELVMQPEDAGTHAGADYAERADGTGYGSVPVWTTAESPGDLSAEFRDGSRWNCPAN